MRDGSPAHCRESLRLPDEQVNEGHGVGGCSRELLL
jgi:hypothetical protein